MCINSGFLCGGFAWLENYENGHPSGSPLFARRLCCGRRAGTRRPGSPQALGCRVSVRGALGVIGFMRRRGRPPRPAITGGPCSTGRGRGRGRGPCVWMHPLECAWELKALMTSRTRAAETYKTWVTEPNRRRERKHIGVPFI